LSARAWLASAIIPAVVIFTIAAAHAPLASGPAERADVTVLYVGADDCPPCRAWQEGEGAAFRELPEFSRLTYREVKSPTLFDVLNDENWPDDLRRYRNRIERGAGVPMWLVIVGNETVSRGYGPTQWRQAILPKIKSLLR
jgi:hypothetical protein